MRVALVAPLTPPLTGASSMEKTILLLLRLETEVDVDDEEDEFSTVECNSLHKTGPIVEQSINVISLLRLVAAGVMVLFLRSTVNTSVITLDTIGPSGSMVIMTSTS